MPLHDTILLASAGLCLATCVFAAIQLALSPGTRDLSARRGNTGRAVLYSFTGAMSPFKKESARRHALTYILGVLFHLGAFLSLGVVALRVMRPSVPASGWALGAAILFLASCAGLILLIRRIATTDLRALSSPDDYASNLLVVGFQLLTAASLVEARFAPWSSLAAAALFLYGPLGKLRHAFYFAFVRLYLGLFYARRGVWGVKKRSSWDAPIR